MRRGCSAGPDTRSPIPRHDGCGSRLHLRSSSFSASPLSPNGLVRRVLARLMPRLPTRRSDTYPVRALFALLGLVLDMLPILVFAAVAYTALSMALDPLTRPRITLSVLVNATIEARLVLCIARNALLPTDTGAVFVPLEAETRNYLYIWIRRFILWAIFGYAVPEAAWWLGAPGAIYALMLNVVGLVLALLSIIFMLQNRAQIATWIAGHTGGGIGLGPHSPQLRRDLAGPRRPLHFGHLPDLCAAHRGRVRLRRARHRSQSRRHRRRAAPRPVYPRVEPARLRHLAGAQGAISDPRAARQPLYSDPDRTDQRRASTSWPR